MKVYERLDFDLSGVELQAFILAKDEMCSGCPFHGIDNRCLDDGCYRYSATVSVTKQNT